MNKNSILLINPNFEPSLSKNLDLLVKVGNDTFSYAIIDSEQKLLYAVYDEQECDDCEQKLAERLKNDSYLNLTYKSVAVALHTQNVNFLPSALVTEDFVKLQSVFFNNQVANKIYQQKVNNTSFSAIYAISKNLQNQIDKLWPNAKILQENAGLLNLVSHQKSTLTLDFSVKSFNIFYHNNEQFIFQKNYQFDNIDEFTYYLLLAANQLDIDKKTTAVKVCGIIHENDEKWDRLSEYFSEINFLTVTNDIDKSILEDMPSHYYSSLTALQQCV